MADRNAAIRQKLEAIQAEMQRLGAWDVQPPPPEALENMGAFGKKTMAFEQWLRHVFAPRVEGLLESGGPWPESSAVGAHAVREFDGFYEADALTRLLCEFDALFGGEGAC
jgi:uncharacterized protein YqcC (DUF446 family)